jgi:hypothetical protein
MPLFDKGSGGSRKVTPTRGCVALKNLVEVLFPSCEQRSAQKSKALSQNRVKQRIMKGQVIISHF